MNAETGRVSSEAVVAALAVLSAVLMATVTGGFDRRNNAYGVVSCNAPPLPGRQANVTLSDIAPR
jgi:hypothetical protein